MRTKAKIEAFLKNPIVDKVLGLGVVLVSVYILYIYALQIEQGRFDWYRLAIAANMAVIIVTTLFRRTAVKVSTNPFFWVITALRTFWSFLVLNYAYTYMQQALAPLWLTNSLLVLSMILIVYSRLSLGLNIGFVPAKRELVTTGAYGYVRHPIHTAEFVFFISYILVSYTPLNLFLLSLGVIFVGVKSLTEESFFKDDEEFKAYKKKVPYLWIPGLI